MGDALERVRLDPYYEPNLIPPLHDYSTVKLISLLSTLGDRPRYQPQQNEPRSTIVVAEPKLRNMAHASCFPRLHHHQVYAFSNFSFCRW